MYKITYGDSLCFETNNIRIAERNIKFSRQYKNKFTIYTSSHETFTSPKLYFAKEMWTLLTVRYAQK